MLVHQVVKGWSKHFRGLAKTVLILEFIKDELDDKPVQVDCRPK